MAIYNNNNIGAYHSPLPHNAHAILHARNTVRDFSEVVLAHCLLFSCEGPVVRRHNVQGVTIQQKQIRLVM